MGNSGAVGISREPGASSDPRKGAHELTPGIGRACRAVLELSIAILLVASASSVALAVDDGSQMASKFRINYLGYFQQGDKVALYLSRTGGSKAWEIVDASGRRVTAGLSRDYVAGDFASGDSFFRIDFSSLTATGAGFRLSIDGQRSEPFDIAALGPYGRLADASFDYFKDHRTPTHTFDQFLHDWNKGSITGGF